jgi:phosphatidyl-myo-inositol dimannoside synthase
MARPTRPLTGLERAMETTCAVNMAPDMLPQKRPKEENLPGQHLRHRHVEASGQQCDFPYSYKTFTSTGKCIIRSETSVRTAETGGQIHMIKCSTKSIESSLLVVTQDFPPQIGGISRYAQSISRALAHHRKVTVLAPGSVRAWNHECAEPYRSIRYPWFHTSFFGFSTVLSEPAALCATRTRVAFHAQYATALGSFIAKRLGLIDRYYIAAHAMEILRENYGPIHLAWRDSVLKDADAVFAVSNYTAELVRRRGVTDDRIEVVYNGVDLNRFKLTDATQLRGELELSSKKIILSVSRLVKRKGIDTLIEAFRNIALRHTDSVLIIVGDGPERPNLTAISADLIQKQRVRFVGSITDSDLPAYYSMADIMIMPSRALEDGDVEGFGLVFLEANACGTAVIGSRVGGIPDAIEDKVSGLLVDPGAVDSLTDALDLLLSDDILRNRLADQGRERAKRFTWEKAAGRILERMANDANKRKRSKSCTSS